MNRLFDDAWNKLHARDDTLEVLKSYGTRSMYPMKKRKLKCIRMSPRALEDIAHPNTIMTFYNVPVDPTTSRKIAVTFDTPKNSYWAVGSTRDKQYTVGVEKRMDGRWCWVIEKP